MVRGVGCVAGGLILGGLGLLAGCSSHNVVEREAWRHEAEAQCLDAGAVREGAGVVRIKPINGPGRGGADFPLRVSTLSQPSALGYNDEVRPPGAIPRGGPDMLPRWPSTAPAAPVRPVETRGVGLPLSLDPPAGASSGV